MSPLGIIDAYHRLRRTVRAGVELGFIMFAPAGLQVLVALMSRRRGRR